jgi:hypothetical protein
LAAKDEELSSRLEKQSKSHQLLIEEYEGRIAQHVAGERFWKDKLEQVRSPSLYI